MFKGLGDGGLKRNWVGFPSASQGRMTFVHKLIDEQLIP
jgi:hypothetical protein